MAAPSMQRAPETAAPQRLAHAPDELTAEPLQRLGEGIGKVVYASQHWVVHRGRSDTEILALVVIWKALRKLEYFLPRGFVDRWLSKPSKQIRFLRVLMQGLVALVPRSIWFMTHIGEVWSTYRSRDRRGEALAQQHLTGTPLMPKRITFPPTQVQVSGWPGWLCVCEAVERMESTLHQRLVDLAAAGKFDEVERWLNRLLDLRQSGWRRGLFSVDAHLKNFGVCGDRVVLLDPGGLTDHWSEVESHLCFEEVNSEPHIQLGLGAVLGSRPDIADRFNDRWRAIVNIDHVREYWPDDRM